MRNSKEAIIGDTLHLQNKFVEPLTGFKPQQPMVFAGVYPSDQSQHVALRTAIEKLILTDSAVTLTIDSSPALGQGWRLGFLGLLHMEVFCQRLEQEHDAEPIITAPSVTYKVKIKNPKLISTYGTDTMFLSNPTLFPDARDVDEYYEPCVIGTIITPTEYLGAVIGLCVDKRGVQQSCTNIDDNRMMLKYFLPLSEIVMDFHDKLKALSSGYASFAGRLARLESINYSNVTVLRIEFQNLLKINHLFVFRNLQVLSLKFNKLDKIENIEMLTKLVELDLSFNFIEKIDNLETLVNLEILSLFNNHIEKLENLDVLENMLILSIGNNRINTLDGIGRLRFMKKLRALNLESNPITTDTNRPTSFRTYVAAILPNLNYYNYIHVTKEERDKGLLAYKDDVAQIEDDQLDEINHELPKIFGHYKSR